MIYSVQIVMFFSTAFFEFKILIYLEDFFRDLDIRKAVTKINSVSKLLGCQ